VITPLPDLLIAPIVRAALAEDLGRAGDLTSQACVPAEARLSVIWAARRPGVLAGLDCARLALAEWLETPGICEDSENDQRLPSPSFASLL
jgi:nicotinate-nucleotide pyrophosphorylase (carboxylating)